MSYLGLHHVAHLRVVAEGLDIAQCAARYLSIENDHEARLAHEQTVDAVRAIRTTSSRALAPCGLGNQNYNEYRIADSRSVRGGSV
ncbi:MAG: hypothetical protein EOP12_03155 [Pseudomonas sp.]|nr:MAG: hypothetical protein EOP12_03155 [Pseudomonas sp.]